MRSLSSGRRTVLPADRPLPHVQQRRFHNDPRQLRGRPQCPSNRRPGRLLPDGAKGRRFLPDCLRSRPHPQRAFRSGAGFGTARAKLSLLEKRAPLPVARLLSRPDRWLDEQPGLSRWRSAFRPRDSRRSAWNAMPPKAPGPASLYAGITCRKCHGPAEQHPAIRNPARLEPRRQGGALRRLPLRFGRWRRRRCPWQPGGLLRQSKCYRNSPGMSCSTCHDVHRVERDLSAMSARCAACHAKLPATSRRCSPAGTASTATCRGRNPK